jgi:hypothetical protein
MSDSQVAAVVNFAAAIVAICCSGRFIMRHRATGILVAALGRKYILFASGGVLLSAAFTLIGVAALTNAPPLGLLGSLLSAPGLVAMQIGRRKATDSA